MATKEEIILLSGTSKRSCKMTEKGKQWQLAMLGDERKKLGSKLTRNESMLYSVRNSTTVQEELNQLDGIFKLVEGINDRMKAVDDKVNDNYDKWFEQLEEKVFSFKRTIHSQIKGVQLERMVNLVPSTEGSKASSLSSSRSLKTRSSSSGRSTIKDKAIRQGMKMAEHLFMEKKRAADNVQVAKAEACAKVLEDLDENCKLKADGSKEFRSRIRRSAT